MNPFVIAFRRIIYSIPLKRLLLGLSVFGILFACFSSAGLSQPVLLQTYTTKQVDGSYTNSSYSIICIDNINCGSAQLFFNWNYGTGAWYSDNGGEGIACGLNNTIYFSTTLDCKFEIYGVKVNEYTSLQCQTEYNLIPISSVDQNYCTTNNLCPSQECPDIPAFSGDLSELYINNILHVGAPTIIMNIPEEIDWDYAYTAGGQNMNIDIVGYNQDFEKIEGRIETNNYKPSSEDFTNIFTGGFSNFGGLLVACLFVILVFYFVKKMFK